MKKTLLLLTVCFGCLFNSMIIVSADVPENTLGDAYISISQEEYIQKYADSHSITYEEALAIDREENANIWNDYIIRNNLPQPRTIIYDDFYEEAGAKIWYVLVENEESGFPAITYGAQGKVMTDAHTETFVKNSFNSPYVYSNNAFFNIGSYSLRIENTSYNNLYLSLVCPVELPISLEASVGGSVKLIEAGFSISGQVYWRKTIYSSHTELL